MFCFLFAFMNHIEQNSQIQMFPVKSFISELLLWTLNRYSFFHEGLAVKISIQEQLKGASVGGAPSSLNPSE